MWEPGERGELWKNWRHSDLSSQAAMHCLAPGVLAVQGGNMLATQPTRDSDLAPFFCMENGTTPPS